MLILVEFFFREIRRCWPNPQWRNFMIPPPDIQNQIMTEMKNEYVHKPFEICIGKWYSQSKKVWKICIKLTFYLAKLVCNRHYHIWKELPILAIDISRFHGYTNSLHNFPASSTPRSSLFSRNYFQIVFLLCPQPNYTFFHICISIVC